MLKHFFYKNVQATVYVNIYTWAKIDHKNQRHSSSQPNMFVFMNTLACGFLGTNPLEFWYIEI